MGVARKLLIGVVSLVLLVVGTMAYRSLTGGTRSADPAPPATSVILIPGYGGNIDALKPIASALGQSGLSAEYADVGNVEGDLSVYADGVRQRIGELKREGKSVGIVGYSAGGLIGRSALSNDESVRLVTIGTPHSGTKAAEAAATFAASQCPTACQQMVPDSEFLKDLSGGSTNWLSIWSGEDDVIRPPSSSDLKGAYVLGLEQCGIGVSHSALPSNPLVVSTTVNFLTETQTSEPGC